MKNESHIAFSSLLAVILLIGCEDIPSPTGTYFGHYGIATECLEIAPNHKYRQVLIQKGRVLYDNTGNWSDRTDGNKGVILYDFIVATDLWPNDKKTDTYPFSLDKYTAVYVLSDWDFATREKVISLKGNAVFLLTDKKSDILNAEQFLDKNQLAGSR
jgi:hypothetical protein